MGQAGTDGAAGKVASTYRHNQGRDVDRSRKSSGALEPNRLGRAVRNLVSEKQRSRAACPHDGTRMFRERDETNGGRSGRHSSVSTLAPNRSARGKKSRGAGFWTARSERKSLRRICSEAAKGCAPPPYRPAAARQPCV